MKFPLLLARIYQKNAKAKITEEGQSSLRSFAEHVSPLHFYTHGVVFLGNFERGEATRLGSSNLGFF